MAEDNRPDVWDEATPSASTETSGPPPKAPIWRRRWMIVIYSVVAVLTAFGIYGASLPPEKPTAAAPVAATTAAPQTTASATPATTADSAATTAPATTASPPTTTAAPAPTTTAVPTPTGGGGDTGRMSDGEFSQIVDATTNFEEENTQLGEGFQKCGVLIQALDLAAASTCVKESYSGFNDDALVLYSSLDDLKDDVGGDCTTQLARYQTRVDQYATLMNRVSKAGENLQFDEFLALSKRVAGRAKLYTASQLSFITACAPS